MRIEPDISGVNVVVLGNFNPVIFTPAWFALHGMLPEHTAHTADLQVAHPDLTVFSMEWLQLRVTCDRFVVSTLREPYVRLSDLLTRIFKEVLCHTPPKAVGINRDVHFRVADLAERDRLGRMLAPTAPWGKWRADLELDRGRGEMASLPMAQIAPPDRPDGGQVRITVEPSGSIPVSQAGVYVAVNDHYAMGSDDIGKNNQLLDTLEYDFERSIRRSNKIIDYIMSLTHDQGKDAVKQSIQPLRTILFSGLES